MRCRARPAHRRGCCCGNWNRTGVAGRPNSGIALDSRRSRSGFVNRSGCGGSAPGWGSSPSQRRGVARGGRWWWWRGLPRRGGAGPTRSRSATLRSARSLGGARAPTTKSGGHDDAHDREEPGHHGEPGQRDRLATIGGLEVDANGLGKRSGQGGGCGVDGHGAGVVGRSLAGPAGGVLWCHGASVVGGCGGRPGRGGGSAQKIRPGRRAPAARPARPAPRAARSPRRRRRTGTPVRPLSPCRRPCRA
jgi:hypothetical protein